MKAANKENKTIVVQTIQEGHMQLFLLGRTPLILNRLAEKARMELLFPAGKKTEADKASQIKHDVMAEFRSSPHILKEKNAPTLLAFPASAPKRAMATAALDLPGSAKKAQIGRLTYITGDLLPVYGMPKLFMAPVRSSDMARTPDIRTRCIVPEWVIPITINYVVPMLNDTTVVSLLNAAGLYVGLGDWRNEKGSASFGQFTVHPKQTPEIKRIMQIGRSEQEKALNTPDPYDDETSELLTWFKAEVVSRGKTASE